MSAAIVIRNFDSFQQERVLFRDSNILYCHGKDNINFMYLQTPLCNVVSVSPLVLECPETLVNIIDQVDTAQIIQGCATQGDYIVKAHKVRHNITPNLDGSRNLLYLCVDPNIVRCYSSNGVQLSYDTLQIDQQIRCVLYPRVHSGSVYWYLRQLKTQDDISPEPEPEPDVNVETFNCLLKNELNLVSI